MLMVSLYIHVSCPLTYVYYSDVYDFAEYRKVTPSYWNIDQDKILTRDEITQVLDDPKRTAHHFSGLSVSA